MGFVGKIFSAIVMILIVIGGLALAQSLPEESSDMILPIIIITFFLAGVAGGIIVGEDVKSVIFTLCLLIIIGTLLIAGMLFLSAEEVRQDLLGEESDPLEDIGLIIVFIMLLGAAIATVVLAVGLAILGGIATIGGIFGTKIHNRLSNHK